MRYSLTEKQQKVLAIIRRGAGRHGRAPTIRAMASEMQISHSRIFDILLKLKERGHILQYEGRIWPIYYGE